MSGHAGKLLDVAAVRMSPRARLLQLRDALAFLLGRVAFGAGAYLLLLAGGAAAVGVALLLGIAAVLVVPVAAAGALLVLVLSVVARPVSPGARDWLARRPLRRAAAAAVVAVASRLASATVWWLLRCRALARRERARVAHHRRAEVPITYRPLPVRRVSMLAVMTADPATWRDLLYLIVVPLYALAACAVSGWAWAGGAVVVATGVSGVAPSAGWRSGEVWALLAAGVAVLLLAPVVTHVLARGGAHLAAALLSTGESARMRAELDEQRLRRQLAVDAAEHERRRIERDLHDGAQQRLVALGMTLGLARQVLRTDPDAAAELVDEAHAEAKLAHAELRDLARGIHPAILADRGLDAALSALLRRLPLPVSIIVALPSRPPAAVESAAYFVVSEALTNVSRHAAATRATVSVTEEDGAVIVEISDDGVGGADPARGTGLDGLRERVAGLNGRLDVVSPVGGPTTIRAELPCGS